MKKETTYNKYSLIGAVAICAAAVMWGIDGVVLRPRLYSLDVPVIVFTEHVLAALLLLPFFRHRMTELKSLNSRDWFSFLWVSLFGGAIGTMAIVGAILYSFKAGTNIAVVLILQKLQPVFAIILSMLVLREVPKKTFFAWGALALVGSYLLSFGASPPSIDGDVLIPIVLALLAAFSFGSSTVFGKFAVRKVSFETATLTRFLLTAGIMFVVLLLSQLLLSFGVAIPYKGFAGFSDIGLSHLTVFIIIVFTTGSGATLLYYFGLKRVMASHATIYELTFPISAILFEYVIHEKLLDLWQFLGAGLILVAITMISGAGNKKESK